MVSIVVPVYNVEQYLNRCVDSLINQSYQDMEIILVDDGSTDSSGRICDDYAAKDVRIRVIHKSNGGLSDARNAALDVISGDELMFVDSDDWIHQDMIRLLHEIKVGNSCDMVACFPKIIDEADAESLIERPLTIEDLDYIVMSSAEAISKIYVTACFKLYDSTIFDKLRYEVGRFHEDEFAYHYMMHNAERVAVIKNELYYYFQRTGSIVHHVNTKKIWDCLDALTDRVLFATDNWSDILDWSLFVGTEFVVRNYYTEDNGLTGVERKQLIETWGDVLNKYDTGHLPLAFKLFFKKPDYYRLYKKIDRRIITWKPVRTGI